MTDVEAILSDPRRSQENRAMDGPRRALDMIDAAGLKPHHRILELEPGKGWFTDILLRLIGQEGQLVVQQPALLDGFFGADVPKKINRADRQNVAYSSAPFTKLAADRETMDRVTWIQGPHEIWFEPKPSVSFGDPHRVFAEIRRVLKPNGRFLVVDNRALPGTPQKQAGGLHRSEPGNLCRFIQAAGFRLIRTDLEWIDSPFDKPAAPTYTPACTCAPANFSKHTAPSSCRYFLSIYRCKWTKNGAPVRRENKAQALPALMAGSTRQCLGKRFHPILQPAAGQDFMT